MKSKNITSYTIKISGNERKKLETILHQGEWEISDAPYAFWKAKKTGISLVAFESGKLTIQGKETHDFVIFTLEPQVTGRAELGYSENAPITPIEEIDDALPLPHAGMDESGKGDFFGPLVIAAVFVEEKMRQSLVDCGVKDSKLLKNDKIIVQIADKVRKIVEGKFSVVAIGPEAYNRLYEKIGNLNKLLAWGHARVLENVLEKAPHCNMALADKFGNESLIKNALLERGQKIKLHQRTKGESDIAVAAASILARDEFVRKIKQLGDSFNTILPKGASHKVDEKVRELVEKHGFNKLPLLGKMHLKSVSKALHPPDDTNTDAATHK